MQDQTVKFGFSQYRKVFESVRKHRVNMNFILDYHPEQFLSKLPGELFLENDFYYQLWGGIVTNNNTAGQ